MECAILLLAHGGLVGAPDHLGNTPLHIAASKGFNDLTVALLKYGGDPNAHAEDSSTPLWNAVVHKNYESACILKSAGGDSTLSGPVTRVSKRSKKNNNVESSEDDAPLYTRIKRLGWSDGVMKEEGKKLFDAMKEDLKKVTIALPPKAAVTMSPEEGGELSSKGNKAGSGSA